MSGEYYRIQKVVINIEKVWKVHETLFEVWKEKKNYLQRLTNVLSINLEKVKSEKQENTNH